MAALIMAEFCSGKIILASLGHLFLGIESTALLPILKKIIPNYKAELLCVFLWTNVAVGTSERFTYNISPNGSYSLLVSNDIWLQSSDISFTVNGVHWSLKNGNLKQERNATSMSGEDSFGRYKKFIFSYKAANVSIHADIRSYSEKSGVMIFSQTYKEDTYGTTVLDMDGVISRFPSFLIDKSKVQLGYMAYSSVFSGYANFKIDKLENGMPENLEGINSGPVVIFDDSDNVLIISPFSHFMAASHFYEKVDRSINWGIMGSVDFIPAGYQMETMVYYSANGINQAMREWGTLLRHWYKRDTAARDSDPTVNYLGYYTDYGAYYYHNTEPGVNYEDTLLDNMYYYKKLGIPYRYIQLDDWWYYVEHTKTSYGAVLKWEARPDVFPHGLQWLYNVTHLPVIAHNRYWSYKTPLAKQNGGEYDFIIDNNTGFALPTEERFWDYLFRNAKKWGLVNYEQDFLITQMYEIKELNSDIFMAEKWLKQMGNSAARCSTSRLVFLKFIFLLQINFRYNIKLQYCMALPRQILQSLQIPAVSHARASTDYSNKNQWHIGLTSLFTDVLGIAPFKDNFWTTKIQPGNPWGRTEVNPVREAIIALLSTGPVGISDRIGYTNPYIATALARADGLLLKPSRPLTAINQQIIQRAFGGALGQAGEVYTTNSQVSMFKFGVIFASQLEADFILTPSEAGLEQDMEQVVYSFNSTALPVSFGSSKPLVLNKFTNDIDMHLYYTTPVFKVSGHVVYLLGELAKFLPISPQRVSSISVDDDNIHIMLSGEPKENVEFQFAVNGVIHTVTCVIRDDWQVKLNVMDKMC